MFSSSEFPDHFTATFSHSGLLEALPTIMMIEDQENAPAGICHHQFEFVNCSYSSGGCGSPSSLVSYSNNNNHSSVMDEKPPSTSSLIQRSLNSHSLPIINDNTANNIGPLSYPPPVWRGTDQLMNLIDSGPFRRVLSSGDLKIHQQQQKLNRSESPLSHESSSSIIEGMLSKACRYSPEEKKEKIERYKSKRTQRNFNKKIKYACRKTLADSRPRIKGRFARNENQEEGNVDQDYDQRELYYECGDQVIEWGNRSEGYQEGSELGGAGYEEEEDDDDNWVSLLNGL